mgnify:CR=1 FL=1
MRASSIQHSHGLEWKPHRTDGLSDNRLFWSYKNQLIGGVLPLFERELPGGVGARWWSGGSP